MIYVIGNKNFSVAVDSIGAELNSIKRYGKEMLWQNYDGSWAGHSPILFPFCGNCAVNIGGKVYPAPKHGILRRREFTLVSQSATELVLRFSSDAESGKLYPYEFSFSVRYAVRGASLNVDYIVENTDDCPLFFGCGGHESFNIDGTLEKHCIEFEKEESLTRLYHDDDGHLTGKIKTYPKSKYLYFKDVPIKNSETLMFKGIKSSWCKLLTISGKEIAKTSFKGFSNILFWRPKNAAMVCMEPWTNLPDFAGGDGREFSEKGGIYRLDAGEKRVITRKITYYGKNSSKI